VCLDHHGAREILRPDCGLLVSKKQLRPAIARLLGDPDLCTRMRRAARDYVTGLRFSDSAAALAEILTPYGSSSER
jgi:hypothetical protein